jgi:hypothetical protein
MDEAAAAPFDATGRLQLPHRRHVFSATWLGN